VGDVEQDATRPAIISDISKLERRIVLVLITQFSSGVQKIIAPQRCINLVTDFDRRAALQFHAVNVAAATQTCAANLLHLPFRGHYRCRPAGVFAVAA